MSSGKRTRLATSQQSMDVDEDEEYNDNHRLFLSYILYARMVESLELSKVHVKLFNDSESMNDTLSKVTARISRLKMDIKQRICDVSGKTYYVMMSTAEAFFTRCSIFSKNQIELLKQILNSILLSSFGGVGKIQTLNSCVGMSKTEAEQTVNLFIKEKILMEAADMEGCLFLTPMAVVEFEPYFNACFADHLYTCDLCRLLVFVGRDCEGCQQRFHFHCMTRWLSGNHSECPKCNKSWAVDMDADTE